MTFPFLPDRDVDRLPSANTFWMIGDAGAPKSALKFAESFAQNPVPDAMLVNGHLFKIVQTPNIVVHLYEEFTKYRQIHADGRQLPVDSNPTWYGYSVGRWEGDTFVVDTAGFKEGSWLTNQGHPHTEALRTTERFRRIDFGYMELNVTIDDPKAYARPWASDTIRFFLQADTELLEHLCENSRDLPNLQKIWGAQEGTPGRPSTTGRQ